MADPDMTDRDMTDSELATFLSPADAAFLDFESDRQPLHIGSCLVYEGILTRQELAHAVESRLPAMPRFRQRIVETPLRLSHPRWADDPDFDLDHHLFEVELAAGLDRPAIGREVGRCFEGKLDRKRPLWKMVLLRGLDCGHTILVWVVHHAMVDGVSLVDLMTVLNDLTPNRGSEPEPATTTSSRNEAASDWPSHAQRLTEGIEHRLGEWANRCADTLSRWSDPAAATSRARRLSRLTETLLPNVWNPVPKTPFNAPISSRRDYAAVELSFSDFRTIRSEIGGTVNDVVLAVLAGGLGRYLRHKGMDTEETELKVLCPVNMRADGERGTLGNQVSGLLVPLYVGIDDPIRRFKAGREAMKELKSSGQALALNDLAQMSSQLPPSWQWLAGKLPSRNRMFNTVSTNVPGPQIPLFLAGHRLLSWYPMGPISADVGLFVAIVSYNQKISIGFTVDPQLVPDVWLLAESIERSYFELYSTAVTKRDESPQIDPETASRGEGRSKKRSSRSSELSYEVFPTRPGLTDALVN